VPDLIGGQDLFMLGNFISYYLTKVRNWPLASSISMVITAVTTLGVTMILFLDQAAPRAMKTLEGERI
jgi:spermidine/putrescine transport system permease protein